MGSVRSVNLLSNVESIHLVSRVIVRDKGAMSTDPAKLDRELKTLVVKAWPEGVPPEEEKFLAALPKKGREALHQRLSALVPLLDRKVSKSEHADSAGKAGVSIQRWYGLRGAWKDPATRTLRSLVPFASWQRGEPANKTPEASREEAIRALRSALADNKSNADIVNAAMETLGKASLSRATMTRLLAELATERTASHGSDVLILDAVATKLVYVDSAARQKWRLHACLLFDGWSGLVLGANACLPGDALFAEIDLLADTAAIGREEGILAGGGSDPAGFVWVVPDPRAGPTAMSPVEILRAVERATQLEGLATRRLNGNQRFGREIARFGGRLGDVDLLPRNSGASAYRIVNLRPDDEIATLEHAKAVIERGMGLHNQSVAEHWALSVPYAERRMDLLARVQCMGATVSQLVAEKRALLIDRTGAQPPRS